MISRTFTIALLATALALPACKRQATGQVVAVVNGQEISLSELNAELRAAGANGNATGADQKAARVAALQRLIDRKLLVQEAKKRNLDKDPDYLQQQIRGNDELLISLLGKQVTSNLAIPTTDDANKYIAANPSMFANRTVYSLDQIVFPVPEDRAKLKQLESAHTMTAVADVLNRLQIRFEQRKGTLDTAIVPEGLMKQVMALPPGEPFVLGANNQVIVSVITGKQQTPLPQNEAQALAVQNLRRGEVADVAAKQLKAARGTAKIDYQSGYAPAKGAAPTKG